MTSPYAIALSHFVPFGSTHYVKLFEFFKTYEAIWQASLDDLQASGVTEYMANKFIAYRQTADNDKYIAEVTKLGIETIDRDDARYPELLKTIADPPIILYLRGQLSTEKITLGIVGSRDGTDYGRRVAHSFARDLTTAGLTIVSGLARGVDVAAHAGALEAGGQTVAVLAHGLEELYGANKILGTQILAQGGVILSEKPPHFRAEGFHFPIRNRIIAGLSRGVLIVEAGLPSGTLITATSAIDNHRDVFAIPGPITSPVSLGANKLIQDGAHIALSPNDILSMYGFKVPAAERVLEAKTDISDLTPEQAAVLNRVSLIPIHVDELARITRLSTSTILGTLTLLEIQGKVRPLGNMFYSL